MVDMILGFVNKILAAKDKVLAYDIIEAIRAAFKIGRN